MKSAVNRGIGFNTVVNLVGQGIPMIVAVIAIPRLIADLGTDRFGILTLAWMIIGYFSLFDLGLARALTQIIAERLGRNDRATLPGVVWTALLIMTVMGCIGGLLAGLSAPWLAFHVLKIPEALKQETLTSFYILAASIPLVIATTGLIGILTAFQRFWMINAVRMPLGISNYLLPVLILPFSKSLVPITLVMVLTRLLSGVAQLALCFRVMPELRAHCFPAREAVGPLFRFGGWMSVTNVVGPMMVYMDRFFIGAVVSISAVAWYATPYEMVTKLGIVAGALAAVIFPAFASAHANNHHGLLKILDNAWRYLLCAIFLPVLLIVAFAHEGLTLWLNGDFAVHSAPILQWLAVGVFVNSFAQIVFALIQAVGRPDLTAKLHFAELLFYLPLLWWALVTHGIVGAAIVWTLRVAGDGLLLLGVAARLLPSIRPSLSTLVIAVAGSGSCFLAAALAENFEARVGVAASCVLLFAALTWRHTLIPEKIKAYLRRLPSQAR